METRPLTTTPLSQPATSEVRDISERERYRRMADCRLQEYLKSYGLVDRRRLETLVPELLAGHEDGPDLPARVIAAAQDRVDHFLQTLLPPELKPKPLWLRAFIETYPEHFLGDPAAAQLVAVDFGDPAAGEPPRSGKFSPQPLPTFVLPRWFLGLLPPGLITCALTGLLLWNSAQNGLSALELIYGLGFASVVVGPAIGMWTALLGVFSPRTPVPAPSTGPWTRDDGALPATALVMPVYHEDPQTVFAAVAAMRESLALCPGGDCFDIFVLSDSRLPSSAADEERAFRRICALPDAPSTVPVYYRRRTHNAGHKAGNLADFCERFGTSYRYVLVLDADSLMSGETMVEMVRRMERAPKVALLQSALHLRNGRSLLSLGQQFVASTCGPLFMRGLAHWAGPHGNYYGHNAIIRVSAFMECCALPMLPGAPPFGGHFLSHDFVEAAQLCRAGWEVRAAWDLQHSWEEMPHTLAEYSARDRRWCQGNLQHLRIVLAQGLTPMSRIHLGVGALGYLTGPLLLLFLALGQWVAQVEGALELSAQTTWILLGSVGACLTLPRLLGLATTLLNGPRRRLHGGALRLVLGVLLEATLSVTTAPILMFHHTRTVLAILTGGAVGWGGRRRNNQNGSLFHIIIGEWLTMLLGLATGGLLLLLRPSAALWLAPCWVPLACAGLIAALLSSPRIGSWTRRLGLFATPSDLGRHPVVERAEALTPLTQADESGRFRDLVLDPLLLAAHLDTLPTQPEAVDPSLIDLRERALRMGPAALTQQERQRLAACQASMGWLHRHAWQRWPVESWDLHRDLPQAPAHGAALPLSS